MLPFGLVCLDVLRHHPARRTLVADVVPAAGPLQNGDSFALVHTEDDAVLGACTAAQRHADARHRARTGRAGTSLIVILFENPCIIGLILVIHILHTPYYYYCE